MAAAPLQLSALLRPATPAFAGYEDFSFAPRGAARRRDDEEDAGDGSRLVADKLAAATDAQGAAAVVGAGPAGAHRPVGPAGRAQLHRPERRGADRRPARCACGPARWWPACACRAGRRRAAQARFTAVVLDTAGRPLPGRAVEVAGRLQQTITHAQAHRRRLLRLRQPARDARARHAVQRQHRRARAAGLRREARSHAARSNCWRARATTPAASARPRPRCGSAAAANGGSRRTTTTASTCCPSSARSSPARPRGCRCACPSARPPRW